jgi:Flp pilus assembly protein TadD
MKKPIVLHLVLPVLLLLPGPVLVALGQEEGGVKQALADSHTLVTKRKWSEALAAYEAVFREYRGDPEVISRVRAIEDDLKLALFMRDFEPKENGLLFGPELVKFSKTSLSITLSAKDAPVGPNWVALEGEWFLNLRFANRLTIELETDTHGTKEPFLVYFCFDSQDRSGYVVVPGAQWEAVKARRSVFRVDGGRLALLESSEDVGPSPGKYKVIRDSSSIRLYQGRKMVLKAKDKKYESGMLGFAALFPRVARISGKLDRDFYQRMSGQLRDRAFREWEARAYSREKVLPAWTLGEVATTDAPTLASLPADAKGLDPIEAGRTIDRVLHGDAAAAAELRRLASRQTGHTSAWLRAILAMASGRMTVAQEDLDRLTEGAPTFGPAYALRGMILIGLRRMEQARADFKVALEHDAGISLAYLGQVLLAIYEGDLGTATGAIERAREAGAISRELAAFEDRLHLVSRGPNWPRRHAHSTPYFAISSNHSKELCREVGDILEAQIKSLRRQFPGVERSPVKTRVYVFSSRAGFLGYAADRLQDLSGAAGAYDYRMREIVLFVPVKREGFVHTVRHEGVHCYMHEFLDDAPMWFNEGLAEYFGSGRLQHGVLYEPGAVNERALETLSRRQGNTLTLEALFLLPRIEFMKDPGLTYAQSWALVHLLSKTRNPVLRNLLGSYFKLLREGQSKEDAFEEVFRPHLARLEKAYQEHLRASRRPPPD